MGHVTLYLLGAVLALSRATTVTYDFNLTWVNTNPDGMFNKPTIGINGQWPIPTIRGDVGDTVVVNVHNMLGNRSTSLHFHGLYMNGTAQMDGPVGTTQCLIPPGSSLKYEFKVRKFTRRSAVELLI